MDTVASPPQDDKVIIVKRAIQDYIKEVGPVRTRSDFWTSLNGFAVRTAGFLIAQALSDRYKRLTYAQKIEFVIRENLAGADEVTKPIGKAPVKATSLRAMLRSSQSTNRMPPNILAPVSACLQSLLSGVIRKCIDLAAERKAPKSISSDDVLAAARDSSVVGAGVSKLFLA